MKTEQTTDWPGQIWVGWMMETSGWTPDYMLVTASGDIDDPIAMTMVPRHDTQQEAQRVYSETVAAMIAIAERPDAIDKIG